MMVEKMWTWSDYREYWYRRVFEAREEAIEDAKENTDQNVKTVIVGQCKGVPLCNTIDADWILEHLDERYRCETGCDIYVYDGIIREEKEWLEAELTKLIDKFHKKTRTHPCWFRVEKVEEVRIR